MTDQPADDVQPAPGVRQAPDEPPLQQHGDPLLAAAEGNPQGEGSRHGHPAEEAPGPAEETEPDA